MATYNFPSHINGDTFDGVQFTVVKNDSPLDLTSASIIMSVDANGTFVDFSTINSKLNITSASSGVFEFSKQIVNFWSYGDLPYEMIFNFPNGDVKTYISGIWTITRS